MVSVRREEQERGYSTTEYRDDESLIKVYFFMAWMYILECVDGSYYVGSTKKLEVRLVQHQEGVGAKYTSKRLPVKLVYSEEYERVDDAFYREKQVQNWSRAKREALIFGKPETLPALAKKKFEKKGLDTTAEQG